MGGGVECCQSDGALWDSKLFQLNVDPLLPISLCSSFVFQNSTIPTIFVFNDDNQFRYMKW